MPNSIKDPFEPIVQRLIEEDLPASEPQSFLAYCEEHGFQFRNTAAHISVDSSSALKPSLAEHGFMVYRLGKPDGAKPGTCFALANDGNGLRNCFLYDREVFTSPAEIHTPVFATESDPLVFKGLFNKPTETLTVNLGFASGLFARILGDPGGAFSRVPAMGQSTFDFSVYPSSEISEVQWQHHNGQVEIDSVFAGQHKGRECIFVLEAKYEDQPFNENGDLAKFKLVYAVQAIKKNIPEDIPIVPLYLRANRSGKDLEYRLCVCSFPDPRTTAAYIDRLVREEDYCFTLPGYAG